MNERIRLLMEFEDTNVKMLMRDGEVYVEAYSTGMALGYITTDMRADQLPNKRVIAKIISNIGGASLRCKDELYLSKDKVFDFIAVGKPKKGPQFKEWINDEVIPTLTGSKFVMGEDQVQAIKDIVQSCIEKMGLTANKTEDVIADLEEPSITMPYSCVKHNIRLFIEEFTDECQYDKCEGEALYEAYTIVCNDRGVEPGCNRAMFDVMMRGLGHVKEDKFWQYISLKVNKLP